MISVMLVDDHGIVRDGLRAILTANETVEVIAEASNGREAVDMTAKEKPDIVLLDISMPDLNGIEACSQILKESATTKVIILSMHVDQRFVSRVFKAGASGYLVKDCITQELLEAIHAVVEGKSYVSPSVASVMIENYVEVLDGEGRPTSSCPRLTPREREVLQLIAEGRKTKDIAKTLHVSIKTIESHRKQIMDKLDIHSIAQLTKFAVREGLTPLELS